jgi:predicted nucleic acid-binding protein
LNETAEIRAFQRLTKPLHYDTNVVSELRKSRPHPGVLAWFESASDKDLHFSAITLGVLQAGVEITRSQDPAEAAEIEAWIDRVAETWKRAGAGRGCLPVLGAADAQAPA